MSAKKNRPSDAVKPQVIDLDPDSVVEITEEEKKDSSQTESEAGASPSEPVQETSPKDPAKSPDKDDQTFTSNEAHLKVTPRKSSYALPVAALIAAAIAGGWLYRDVIASYFPGNEVQALATRVQTLEGNNATLASDISTTRQKIDQLKSSTESELGASRSATQTLQEQQSATEPRLAKLEKQLSDISARIASLGTGSTSSSNTAAIDPAVLASLNQRIDALEAEVAALKSAAPKPDDTSALSQALSDLKARISEGAPFATEFARIEQLVPAAEGLNELKQFAELGLPTAQGLATELRGVAPTLPTPAAPTPDSEKGYWESFTGLFSNIIKVRDIGVSNWPELAEKCASLAESGDLTQAIQLIADAEGEIPSALAAWRDRATGRLQLEAAIAKTSEAVMRQIAAKG
jgi:hypothetical protein